MSVMWSQYNGFYYVYFIIQFKVTNIKFQDTMASGALVFNFCTTFKTFGNGLKSKLVRK